jgi:hypothetical protein
MLLTAASSFRYGGGRCQAAVIVHRHRLPEFPQNSNPHFCCQIDRKMENPPLASLSLTHVHYVCFPHLPLLLMMLTWQEPCGPHLLPLRLAGPCAAGTMCSVCHADMVES